MIAAGGRADVAHQEGLALSVEAGLTLPTKEAWGGLTSLAKEG